MSDGIDWDKVPLVTSADPARVKDFTAAGVLAACEELRAMKQRYEAERAELPLLVEVPGGMPQAPPGTPLDPLASLPVVKIGGRLYAVTRPGLLGFGLPALTVGLSADTRPRKEES